ncbi:MAG: hypothetical protein P4N60_11125 [Verrucomicrobiae bacterium]|nr:hypothetical protein [Verrucomicrobiae bacterium]
MFDNPHIDLNATASTAACDSAAKAAGDEVPMPSRQFKNAPITAVEAGRSAVENEAGSHSQNGAGDWQIGEANRRQSILETFAALVAGGMSKTRAAKKVGIGYTTLWRWETAYAAHGFNGLIPDVSTGRKSELMKLGFTPDQVRELMAKCQGLNLDTESTTTALRLFAHTEECPEELSRVILDPNRCSKHAIPPSIRRAATPSKNSRLAHRGPRSLDLKGFWIPRTIDILPGDIFVPDDTTPIFGWWVPWIQCDDYPFGVKLLQGQLLRIIDVASQCAVGRVLIAREKSSYRASDIWAWVGFMADDIGLPRLGFQMERGSWDATILQGVEIEESADGVTHSRRVGGLRQLPANITPWHQAKLGSTGVPLPTTLQTWTSYLPKSKSIEAFFDRSQALEGTLYGCLGRDQMRRPFEKAKKLFQQCCRPGAKIDMREHFLSGTEIMARLNQMDDFLANEPMEGEVFKGVPQQKLQAALSEFPLYQMPEESRWLYRRDWKRLTITQGWARVRLTDPMSSERYSLFYVNPRIFAEIEGRDVIVYYDRENFETPAQIVAASRFSIGSREFMPGDYVCEADYFQRPGMFLDQDRSGHDVRKAWKNAVMTIYGRASVHAPSRQVPESIREQRKLNNEATKEQSFSADQPTPFAKQPASTTVDGRPAAAPVQRKASERAAGVSEEEMARQAARLERQEQQYQPTPVLED